jgi:hypothetical protein
VLLRLHKWLLIVALVTLIGGHWALLQSAAWMGMIYNYSHRSTVAEAIDKTFSGKFPCQLCKLVRAGKVAEKVQDIVKPEQKFDFSFVVGPQWLFPPKPSRQFIPTDFASLARLEAPQTPPPRLA